MTLENILCGFSLLIFLIECVTLNYDLSLDQWTVAFRWHIQISGFVTQYREKNTLLSDFYRLEAEAHRFIEQLKPVLEPRAEPRSLEPH